MVDEETHELFRLRGGGGVFVAPALEVDERKPGQFYSVARDVLAFRGRNGTALDHVPVLALGRDRSPAAGFARKLQRIAELAKQPQLEAPQDRLDVTCFSRRRPQF